MSQARPPTPPFGRTVKLQQGYEMHYLEHGSGPPVVAITIWPHSPPYCP